MWDSRLIVLDGALCRITDLRVEKLLYDFVQGTFSWWDWNLVKTKRPRNQRKLKVKIRELKVKIRELLKHVKKWMVRNSIFINCDTQAKITEYLEGAIATWPQPWKYEYINWLVLGLVNTINYTMKLKWFLLTSYYLLINVVLLLWNCRGVVIDC